MSWNRPLGDKVFLIDLQIKLLMYLLVYLLVGITEKILNYSFSFWLLDQKNSCFTPCSNPDLDGFKKRAMKYQPMSLLHLKPLLPGWVSQCKLLLECTM